METAWVWQAKQLLQLHFKNPSLRFSKNEPGFLRQRSITDEEDERLRHQIKDLVNNVSADNLPFYQSRAEGGKLHTTK
jgi:hypothetical protein